MEKLGSNAEALGRGIDRLTLVDVVAPPVPAALASVSNALALDLSDAGAAAALASLRPDLIFHLAAIVSGEAEADFEKGYRVNLDGTRSLFEAIRVEGQKRALHPAPDLRVGVRYADLSASLSRRRSEMISSRRR